MEFQTLNNGVKMPRLGFGVFQMREKKELLESVATALDTGYRLIDTAASYLNEEYLGQAIKESRVPREDLFLTTKLWIQDTGYENTKKAFEKSLKRLQVEYLDLYLIHQPYGDVHGSWRAMEELYKEGKIRAIGLSNFTPDRVMDIIVHNDIQPAVNQIELNPFYQQTDTIVFLKENKVQVESWGPFAEGKNNIFKNELLINIGESYHKSVAQVILRWLLQQEIVAIPKSVTTSRIQENFDVFDFKLTKEEMDIISTLDCKESQFFNHRDPEMVRQLSSRKMDI